MDHNTRTSLKCDKIDCFYCYKTQDNDNRASEKALILLNLAQAEKDFKNQQSILEKSR